MHPDWSLFYNRFVSLPCETKSKRAKKEELVEGGVANFGRQATPLFNLGKEANRRNEPGGWGRGYFVGHTPSNWCYYCYCTYCNSLLAKTVKKFVCPVVT